MTFDRFLFYKFLDLSQVQSSAVHVIEYSIHNIQVLGIKFSGHRGHFQEFHKNRLVVIMIVMV